MERMSLATAIQGGAGGEARRGRRQRVCQGRSVRSLRRQKLELSGDVVLSREPTLKQPRRYPFAFPPCKCVKREQRALHMTLARATRTKARGCAARAGGGAEKKGAPPRTAAADASSTDKLIVAFPPPPHDADPLGPQLAARRDRDGLLSPSSERTRRARLHTHLGELVFSSKLNSKKREKWRRERERKEQKKQPSSSPLPWHFGPPFPLLLLSSYFFKLLHTSNEETDGSHSLVHPAPPPPPLLPQPRPQPAPRQPNRRDAKNPRGPLGRPRKALFPVSVAAREQPGPELDGDQRLRGYDREH